MRLPVIMLLALACGCGDALAQQPPAPNSDASTTRFDGSWDVMITCPDEEGRSGARGYSYRFAGEVRNGVLHAQHRAPDAPGSLEVEGVIQPDGSAQLNARGRTGHPDYVLKRLGQGTPYSYRIKAQFEETRGSGSRLDSRPCEVSFSRRR